MLVHPTPWPLPTEQRAGASSGLSELRYRHCHCAMATLQQGPLPPCVAAGEPEPARRSRSIPSGASVGARTVQNALSHSNSGRRTLSFASDIAAPREAKDVGSTRASGAAGERHSRRWVQPSDLKISVRGLALAVFFGGVAGLVKTLLSSLPPDFITRWRQLFADQPLVEKQEQAEPQQGTVIYDRHGAVLATIVAGGYSGKQRDQVDPARQAPLRPHDIPSAMWQAVVASEDRRFFEHQGVDPRGILRAVLSLATSGGGSTITQQLVKNVFLSNERKWSRKLIEILLALLIEKQMSKWDILHLYLNKIYWGHGVHGIQAASALYFGKHPSLLSLGECAMLAGIIPAPELLSPYRDPSRGKKPQARTLRRMVEAGFLDAETAAAAVNEPIELGTEATDDGTYGPWRAPYFVSEVLYELTQKYGREKILTGGLQVHTTLDATMQDIAERVIRDGAAEYDNERVLLADEGVERVFGKLEVLWKEKEEKVANAINKVLKRIHVDSSVVMSTNTSVEDEKSAITEAINGAANAAATQFSRIENLLLEALAKFQEESKAASYARLEGAMVAMDPEDGAVRVLVGGRDYYESNFNRATQALRPPGSTFKPVVYLAALAEGIERDHILVDEPYTIGEFSPENYDKKFRGQVTLEEALLRSLNVPTVKLCAEIGVDKVCRMARALGIETYLPYELPLSLGGCELTPLQLTTIYSTVAAGGIHHKPYLITLVENSDGQVLEEAPVVGHFSPAVDEYAVSELRKLLQAVVERGTGRHARLGRPCAGKTGTSDGHRDVWFAGFTPELACVVWFGYDDNRPVGGIHPGTGASHAAPIWQEFMQAVLEGIPVGKFKDIGRDKDGSRALRDFEKKSRRMPKVGIKKIFSKGRGESFMERSLGLGQGKLHVGRAREDGRVDSNSFQKDIRDESTEGTAASDAAEVNRGQGDTKAIDVTLADEAHPLAMAGGVIPCDQPVLQHLVLQVVLEWLIGLAWTSEFNMKINMGLQSKKSAAFFNYVGRLNDQSCGE